MAFILLSGAGTARAMEPCSLIGNPTFAPGHPGRVDSISYNVSLPWFLFPAGSTSQIVAKATVGPGNLVGIDVVLTSTPGDFAGWQLVNLPFRADSAFGIIGPLPPGEYAIRTDVRVRDPSSGTYGSVCPGVLPRVNALSIAEDPAPVSTVKVVEFYNASLDHYFITADAREIAYLESGVLAGWKRTGQVFTVYAAGASDARGKPTCRWYGLPAYALDTHFFSASSVECNEVATSPLYIGRWQEETPDAFEATLPDTLTGACPSGTLAVYRLWNNRADSNHRYTTDVAIRNHMVSVGYVPEGFGPGAVAMCALPS